MIELFRHVMELLGWSLWDGKQSKQGLSEELSI